jgi:hypothetical protein
MNDDLDLRILRLFTDPHREGWDLHAFFELAGDAHDRAAVLETVDGLVADGHLESRGSDFYTLTDKGREAAQRGSLTP